jgi:putative ABC transport system permease protein
MTTFLADLKHGVRVLVRSPLFTICTISALTLGIGSTTALFTVVNALLLKPLPYKDPHDLMVVWEHNIPRNRPRNVVSPANYLEWKVRNRSFERMAAFSQNRVTLTGDGEPAELSTIVVTADLLDLLGVLPVLGRGFREGEDQEGAARTMVLGQSLWVRRFGADPSVVGRTVTINGGPVTIIGVMPAGFEVLGQRAEVYIPFQQLYAQARRFTGRSIMTLARLRPGVTRDQAQAEMAGVMAELVREQPDFNTGWTVNVVPLRDQLVGDIRVAILALFAAVGAVLLIACGNIGSLMLSRASARRRELAIRSALGAGTGRILRQLLTETLLLSIVGGAAGLAFAWWMLTALVTWIQGRLPLPLLSQITLDGSVLAFAAGITVLTAIVCGLAPALGSTGESLVTALRDGAPTLAGSARGRAVRHLFVIGEIALAVTVLCGAGLLGRSLMQLQSVHPGFTPDSALSLRVTLPSRSYQNSDAQHQFHMRAIDGLKALPGVSAAGGISFLPLAGIGPATSFWRADAPPPPPSERPVADARPVTPGFFEAMGIQRLAGRDIAESDTEDRDPVAVINETFARQIYPGDNPIGRRFILNLGNTKPHEIVGVVGDVKLASLDGEVRATAYLSSRQYAFGIMSYVVRASGDAARLAPAATRIIHEIDPLLPVSAVRPLTDVFAESIALPRLTTMAMGVFAGVALLLAALGVYGVVAYSVSQRVREFGIRMALGARPGEIVGMVVRQTLMLIGLGLVAGIVAAVPATRLMRGMLYQIGPNDPITFVSIGALLAGVGCLAAYLPAKLGTQLDPVATLRAD